MDAASFASLLTPPGQALLAEARQVYDEGALVAARLLSRSYPSDVIAAALTQERLRRRASTKFGADAARMYFTPNGLEQATSSRVAQHRAARLAAAGLRGVLDVGCGIGGDLIAFARAGFVAAGVDLDPVRVAVAEANLRALGLAGAVQVADGTRLDVVPFDVVFADPSRRNAKGRVFDVAAYQPSWEFVTTLLQRRACVKVAPGIPHALVPTGVEAEWVSYIGEVKEAALWSPSLATVERRATVIHRSGLATLTDEDDPGDPSVRPVQRFLYEPDGAAIRAGLVTAVAATLDGGLLDEHIAYITADHLDGSPFARSYEVLEILPYREKALKAALRQRNIGSLTIKKRGVAVVPDQLRSRLGLTGVKAATLVLTRAAGKGIALLVAPASRE